MRRTREALFKAQDGRCFYCQREMTLDIGFGHTVTRDHVTPIHKGGRPAARANVTGACFRCNQFKGSMTIVEFFKAHPDPSLLPELHPGPGAMVQRQPGKGRLINYIRYADGREWRRIS